MRSMEELCISSERKDMNEKISVKVTIDDSDDAEDK